MTQRQQRIKALKDRVEALQKPKSDDALSVALNRLATGLTNLPDREKDIKPVSTTVTKMKKDMDSKHQSITNSMSKGFDSVSELIDKTEKGVTEFTKKNVEALVKELKSIKKELGGTIADLENTKDISDTERAELRTTLKTANGEINKILDVLKDEIKDRERNEKVIKEDLTEVKSDVKKIEKELDDKLDKTSKNFIERFATLESNRGGSMNRQIKVNGVDELTTYTDINLVGSITATDDNTNKRVNIDFSAVGGVDTVSNADGTLTISPTTGNVVASRAAITGDVSVTAGSNTSTLATVNGNVGSFGSATQSTQITANAKGLITAIANVTITPNFANILGGTAGSVIFSNGTNLAQDNANFFWDDTNNRLGIGMTPTEVLDVTKSQNGVSFVKLTNATNGTAAQAVFGLVAGANSLNIGNLPAAYISVITWDRASGSYMQTDGAGGIALASRNAAGIITFHTGGEAEKVRIAANGYVGIGDTPATKLHIYESTASTNNILRIENLGTNNEGAVAIQMKGRNANADSKIFDFVTFNSGGNTKLLMRVLNDAENAATSWAEVVRSGMTLTTLSLVPTNGEVAIGTSANTAIGEILLVQSPNTSAGTLEPVTFFNKNSSSKGGAVIRVHDTQVDYGVNATAGAGNFSTTISSLSAGNPMEGIRVLSSGLVGIMTTAPDRALEINSATGINLRLTYNDANGSAANYADLLTSSSGDLTITPSGGDVILTTAVAVTHTGSANNRAKENIILYGATTDAATAVELTSNGAAGSGATNRISVPTDTALSVVLNICVKQSGSANAKQMLRQFVISNNGGTTAIQGTVVTLGTDSGSAGLTTVTCTVTANDTDDCIKVEVNGVAVTNLRYTAYLISTETLYA